ncbi:MAG: hypothetical protein KDI46_09645 [Alphaproteobacteria bacterium]|nr:hypothetical protein [Alphaproteobacteria bacterium]
MAEQSDRVKELYSLAAREVEVQMLILQGRGVHYNANVYGLMDDLQVVKHFVIGTPEENDSQSPGTPDIAA